MYDHIRAEAPSPRVRALLWTGLGALGALWAAASLCSPLFRDNGIYAALGDAILRGGIPYRDAWDTKGPVVFYVAALAQLLFGRHMWGLRALDLALLAAAMWAVATVAAHAAPAGRRWVARYLAVALFLLAVASVDAGSLAQADGWAATLIALAVALVVRAREPAPPAAYLTAGLLIGTSALIKPFYGAFLLLLAIRAAYPDAAPADPPTSGRGAGGRAIVPRALLAAAAGAALALGACLAWFWLHGALREMVEGYVLFNAQVYARSDRASLDASFAIGGRRFLTTLTLSFPFAAVGVWTTWRRPLGAILVCWLVLALAAVLLQGRFWQHHWLPAYAPLATLAALGGSACWAAARAPGSRGRRRRVVHAAAGGLALVLAAYEASGPALQIARWINVVTGRRSESAILGGGVYGRGPGTLAALADSVARWTAPGDRVQFWGMEGLVNYLSGRASPTPFLINLPLCADSTRPIVRQYQREYLERFAAHPPRYFLVFDPAERTDHGESWRCLQRFAPLRRTLDERYRELPPEGSVHIFLLER